MAKLLSISTKVHLPGATGATWSMTFPPGNPYLIAGRLAGGLIQGDLEAVPNEDGWWQFPESQKVFGGELGNLQPPLVTTRIYPQMSAGLKSVPIPFEGHPHEIDDSDGNPSGTWDLSKVGGIVGPVIVPIQFRLDLEEARVLALAAAERGELNNAAVSAALALLGDDLTGLDAITALMNAGLFDLNNGVAASNSATALAVAAAGLKSADSLAAIPAAPGVYRIMKGVAAGQVWERLADGTLARQPQLEALSATAPALSTISRVSTFENGVSEAKTDVENGTAFMAAITDAISRGRTLSVTRGTYDVTGVDISALLLGATKPLHVEFEPGAVLRVKSGAPLLIAKGGMDAQSYPVLPAGLGSYTLTVTGGTWAVGDYLYLQSDDVWDNAGFSDSGTNYSGEQVRVLAVQAGSNNTFSLTLFAPLCCDYLTNPTAVKLQHIRNFGVHGGELYAADPANFKTALIYTALHRGLTIEGLHGHDYSGSGLLTHSNLGASYADLTFQDGINNPPSAQYGYGLVLGGAEQGASITNLRGRNLRHTFTLGAGGALGGVAAGRGVTRNTRLTGLTTDNNTNNAFDTHSQADGLVASDIVVRGGYGAIFNRGRNITISNFGIQGIFGGAVAWDSAARNVTVENGTISNVRTAPPGTPTYWRDGTGVALIAQTKTTQGSALGGVARNITITDTEYDAVNCDALDMQLDNVRVTGSQRLGFYIGPSATQAVLTDCSAVGGASYGFDINTGTARLIRPRAEGNQKYGMYARVDGLGVEQADLKNNHLEEPDPLLRLNLVTGYQYVRGVGRGLGPQSGNPTLAKPGQNPNFVTPFGVTTYNSGTWAAVPLANAGYLDGQAYQYTLDAGADIGILLFLAAGVVWTAIARASAVSGTWNLTVSGPRDQGKSYQTTRRSVPNADLLASAANGYVLVSFAVPVSGFYRVAVSCSTAGQIILDGLDVTDSVADDFQFQPVGGLLTAIADLHAPDTAQAMVGSAGPYPIGTLLNSIARMLKSITGQTNWYNTPPVSLGAALPSLGRLFLNAVAGSVTDSDMAQGGVTRWTWRSAADGTILQLLRRNDAGASVGAPISVNRATGVLTLTDSSVVVAGTYLRPLYLGNYAFWVDPASGKLYTKNGTPTNATDGTVVGTQA